LDIEKEVPSGFLGKPMEIPGSPGLHYLHNGGTYFLKDPVSTVWAFDLRACGNMLIWNSFATFYANIAYGIFALFCRLHNDT
jgi:hypothetical protein